MLYDMNKLSSIRNITEKKYRIYVYRKNSYYNLNIDVNNDRILQPMREYLIG